MFQKIISFFMAIFAFFASLFGGGAKQEQKSYIYLNEKYGSHERQVVDFYIPKENNGTCGLILMIHGGAWIAGSKEVYGTDALNYISNEHSIAAAALNYRYIDENTNINDILDDIDAALKVIKEKGAQNGVDINKVMLTGTSAGAHLSLLYAYSRKNTAPITPACVVSYCSPTNLADPNFYYGNNMGDTAFVCKLASYACGFNFDESNFSEALPYLAAVSPVSYVSSDCVPTALGHGMKDVTVPYSNAVELDAKLTQFGVKHDFVTYPNSDHGLSNDKDSADKMNELMYNYAYTYLK